MVHISGLLVVLRMRVMNFVLETLIICKSTCGLLIRVEEILMLRFILVLLIIVVLIDREVGILVIRLNLELIKEYTIDKIYKYCSQK